ncbi:hypothetical protein, partial [Klebsiella pneumoniae]|uniref:hypothetical protein n=1 Tax=Klebsiella pneumoniae TaxID=573 RepID=UPI0030138AC9
SFIVPKFIKFTASTSNVLSFFSILPVEYPVFAAITTTPTSSFVSAKFGYSSTSTTIITATASFINPIS